MKKIPLFFTALVIFLMNHYYTEAQTRDAVSITITGPDEICPGSQYSYSATTEYGFEDATIKDTGTLEWYVEGGTKTGSGSSIQVTWNETSSNKYVSASRTIEIYMKNKSQNSSEDYEVKNAPYFHGSDRLNISSKIAYEDAVNLGSVNLPNQSWFCPGDSLKSISVDTSESHSDISFEWYFDGTRIEGESGPNINLFTIPADYSKQEFIFSVDAYYNSCPNVFRSGTHNSGTKYIRPKIQQFEINPIAPECNNSDRTAEIELDGLSDFSAYTGYDANTEYSYTVSVKDLAGEVIATVYNVMPPYYLLDTNVVFIADNTGENDLRGLNGNTDYEIMVEADDLACSDSMIVTTPSKNPTSLNNVSPAFTDTYNDSTYHIPQNGGLKPINLDISGDNAPFSYTIRRADADTVVLEGTVQNTGTSATQPIPAGDFSVTIDDSRGCAEEVGIAGNDTGINLKEPEPLTYDVNTISSVTCNRQDSHSENTVYEDGFISVLASGGIGSYTLSAGRVSHTNTTNKDNLYTTVLDNLPPGLDTFTLSTDYENVVFDTLVPSPDSVSLEITSVVPPVCLGDNTGSVSFSFEGGNDDSYNYSYGEAPGYTMGNETGVNEPGEASVSGLDDLETYRIQVKDSEGCYQEKEVYIPENPNPVQLEVMDAIEPTCYEWSDGKIEVRGFGGDPGEEDYHYKYKQSGTGFYAEYSSEIYTDTTHLLTEREPGEGLPSGFYQVYIEDTNECLNKVPNPSRYMESVRINQPAPIELVSKIVQPVSREGAGDGSVSFKLEGGNDRYTYRLEGDGISNRGEVLYEGTTGGGTTTLDSLPAGDYLLHYQDICGCDASNIGGEEVIIQLPPDGPLTLLSGATRHIRCFGNNDGVAILQGYGGWPPYEYSRVRNNGYSSMEEFSDLGPGNHVFYVRDTAGVIDSLEITMFEPQPLIATITGVNHVSCHGGNDGAATLSIEGGRTPYEFSMDTGLTWQAWNNGTNQPAELTAGTHEILVRDSTGWCAASTEVALNQPDPLEILSIESTDTRCGFSEGRLSADIGGGTPPYTYLWMQNETVVSTDSLAADLPAGNYSLTVTDSQGCITTFDGLTISNSNAPHISGVNTIPITCPEYSDGEVTLNCEQGIPPYTIRLLNGPLETSGQDIVAGEHTFTGLPAGRYTLEVEDQNGCKVYQELTIASKEPLSLDAEKVQPQCHGGRDGSIKLSAAGANGGYSYQWQNGISGPLAESLFAGDYPVTVVDSLGCSEDFTVTLAQPDKVTVDLGNDIVICGGQDWVLDPSDFEIYNWKYEGEEFGNSQTLTITQEGTYTLEAVTEKGCVARDTLELIVDNDLLEADFIMTSQSHVGDTVVVIDISWPEPDSVSWVFGDYATHIGSSRYTEMVRYEEPGEYPVMLRSVKAQCRDSLMKTITILGDEDTSQVKLGAQEPLIQDFKIYPNPNSGEFTAEVELREEEDIILDLIHLNKGVVKRKQGHGMKNYRIQYRLHSLTPGVYVLSLRVKNEKKTLRIIIS